MQTATVTTKTRMGMSVNDAAARSAALDVSRSFVVQAPAGSGKTTLLTQRLLRLLTTVRQPEQVLAITFTRKAAEEMRARIIAALDLASEPLPDDPFRAATHAYASAVLAHDRALGWDLRAQPSRLRIMTIDALCQNIVRQAPISARLPSAQRVEENATQLYREAARETVAGIADGAVWSAPLAHLLAHFDNDWDKLEKLLADMLARRDQWLRVLHRGAELAALETGFERVVATDLQRVRNALVTADLELQRGRAVQDATLAHDLPKRFSRNPPWASDAWLQVPNSWSATAEVDPTAQLSVIVLDRRWLKWSVAVLALMAVIPFLRMWLRWQTGEWLATHPYLAWASLGLIWWTCLAPSVIGFGLLVVAAITVLRHRWQRLPETVKH